MRGGGRWQRSWPTVVLAAGGIGVITFLLVIASLAWFRPTADERPWWWLPTAAALALVVRAPRRWWPALVGSFALGNTLGSWMYDDIPATVLYTVVNVIELLTCALILAPRRVLGAARPTTTRARENRIRSEAVRFVAAAIIAITFGALVLAGGGRLGWGILQPEIIFRGYVISHLLGILTLGVLLLPNYRPRRPTRLQWVETGAVAVFAAALCLWTLAPVDPTPHAIVLLVPVVWAGARLGSIRATSLSLAVLVLATVSTTHGRGTFAAIADPMVRELNLQAFTATVGITVLALVLVSRHRALLADHIVDQERTLRIAIRDALIGIATISFRPGSRGTIVHANTALAELVGYAPVQLVGQPVQILFTAPDGVVDATVDEFLDRLTRQHSGALTQELPAWSRAGTKLWVQLAGRAVTPRFGPPFALLYVHDLTMRAESEELLERMALHDALTGLANRTLIFRRLTEALHTARPGQHAGLIYLDLDRFKSTNDTYGHAAGDEVLRHVATRIRQAVRLQDTAGRLGGDEFAVVCVGLGSAEQLTALTESIRQALTDPAVLSEGTVIPLAASIGAALAEPGSDADTVIRAADAAMYQHKVRERL